MTFQATASCNSRSLRRGAFRATASTRRSPKLRSRRRRAMRTGRPTGCEHPPPPSLREPAPVTHTPLERDTRHTAAHAL
eukprot:3100226-Prymnesium_polylepis.1